MMMDEAAMEKRRERMKRSLITEAYEKILRCAQDDNEATCHPERSEGS